MTSGASSFTRHLPRRPAARILAYHEVLPEDSRCPNPFNQVSASMLEAQLDRLLEAGYTFGTASEIARRIERGEPDLDRHLCLTFDDGLEEHASVVLPILTARRIRATFYVVTGNLGSASRLGRRSGRHLTPEEVLTLAHAGMEVGSHSRTHPVLARLASQDVVGEILGSHEDLARLLPTPPTSFAYPYGSRRTFDARSVEAIARAGYHNAVSTVVGGNRPGVDLYALRRIPVYGTDGPALALARARGAFDWTGSLQEVWLSLFPHHSTRAPAPR